ncbi:hypothetical protein [Bacillus taeanensis]|uniref:hypothetical protein n=1 Tax=Bacillus taeanensis TaxID=273032 RepID=UPI0015F0AC8B|nr:hypothetical protein [Bacillus taeanensis]
MVGDDEGLRREEINERIKEMEQRIKKIENGDMVDQEDLKRKQRLEREIEWLRSKIVIE